MGRLDGKVATITGAGSGIGRATAVLFANEGAKVVVADWVAETGEETVRKIVEAGGEAIFVKTDVSRAESVKNMVQKTIDAYGKLDIIFNNAGVGGQVGPTEECTEENWDKVINVNLKGVWLGMKYAIPEMLKTGGGVIINTSSINADRGMPNLAAYTASKGGVLSLSRVTAVECAPKNIRVNCINPGPTASAMLLAQTEENLKHYIDFMPLHRMAAPEELARVALFLASDESSFVVGHALVADGGMDAYAGCVAFPLGKPRE